MNKKEVFAWSMYDLANTIFSALFVTFFFPFYVKQFLGGNEFQIGLVFGLSMLLVGLVVPVIGAWSDHIGRRMPFIVFFTIVCCVLTFLVAEVSLMGALIAGFFANFTYHAALTTYNALMPKLAKPSEMGWLSGIGTGVGYFGTLIALAIAAVILSRLGWESAEGSRAVFAATALMFFVFSLPTFLGIHEPHAGRNHRTTAMFIRDSFASVYKTLSNIARHKSVFMFFLAMFFFTNAINAVIVFLFLFARQQINLSVQAFFVVYTIQSFGAVFGSFVSGKLSDRFGPKKVLVWSGLLWLLVIGLLYFVSNLTTFVIAGVLGGAALGMVWTAQRPKMLEMVSRSNVGQFFGFLELSNKFSGVIGPIVFGALAKFVNYQAALVSLLVFFAIGLYFLRLVPGDDK
jgi:UMF1 family MFS transporter